MKDENKPMKNNSEESAKPSIPGKGAEPAKVSKIELKDPKNVEMSEADKKVMQETRPKTSDSHKQQDLAVNKGGGYGKKMTTNT